jgi:hypothetical protein
MEKIKINLQQMKDQTFKFGDTDITIRTRLSVSEKIALSEQYLSILFDDKDASLSNRYLIAEYSLILQIVYLISNIDTENDMDADLFVDSGLWDEIKKRLVDYESFRYDLNRLILLYQYERNAEVALGSVIENVVAKLSETIDRFSESDVTDLKEASVTFVDALNKLNERVPGIANARPSEIPEAIK